ncbi:MAG: LytTR family transcriptional regulator DNA-binding domain-containing protein [Bacteroidales bacterium]|nr:LytTR family transcriptional regulator DNA-binding domain-containing protein [Bacteroidales bacterium]
MAKGYSILHHFRRHIFYMALWLVASIIQTAIILFWNSPLPFRLVLVDSLLFNLLFVVGVIPLWYPIRFNALPTRRKTLSLIPYILIAVILTVCCYAVGNHLMRLVATHPDYIVFLEGAAGWRIIQGILFYTATLLYFSQQAHISHLTQKVNSLQQTFEKEIEALARITVKERQQIHIIPVDEIEYLEACGDYVQLHTAKGVFLKEHTMKFLEERLSSKQFVRVHRSFIVNISQVDRIELYEKERYRLFLKNGKTVKASDAGYKLLKESL